MLLQSWLHNVFAAGRITRHFAASGRRSRQHGHGASQVEVLDARTLLTVIDLASLGAAGTTISGIDSNDLSGRTISDAGDVNGDGFDDILIGTYKGDGAGNSKYNAGESYLIFGGPALPSNLSLASLGSAGITIFGAEAVDESGISVSGAGDVNGDGFDDLIVGARRGDAAGNLKYGAGESFVIFGGASLPSTIDLGNSGAVNVTIFGADAGDESGISVSSAGDVNGDGYDDLLIGAHQADAAGNGKSLAGDTYIVFGGPALPATIDLNALGASGVTIYGSGLTDRSGRSVSDAGDVNGDGFDDILIGAPYADAGSNINTNEGESYLVFGGPSLPSTIDLANLGSGGVTFFSAGRNDYSGFSVSGAGDINGDGFADVLVGAIFADAAGDLKSYAGETYAIFGGPNLPGTINLGALGTAGVTILGADSFDFSGRAVSGAGDVNGDGFDDLLIGANKADAANNAKYAAGESYLIFGSASLPSTIDLKTDLGNSSTLGNTIFGAIDNDGAGFAVSGAGDVNGDGFGDFLVSAPYADKSHTNNGTNEGETYILYGGNATQGSSSATQAGTSSGNVITGSAAVDKLVGGGGNDTLLGLGGADVLYGGQGDDILAVSDNSFRRADGGNGTDTLRLDGGAITLDLTNLADSKLTNIEIIDIRTGTNTLILNQLEVLNITANSNSAHTSNTLIVRMGADDTLDKGTGWTQGADAILGGVTYSVFTQGAATLLVETFGAGTEISSAATSPTITSPIPVTVTFTESVTGFTDTDVIVVNGTISNFQGSGTTYTFDVNVTNPGLVTVDVPASVAVNGSNVGNSAASQFSIIYINVSPVAYDDAFSTNEDTALNLPQANLTANDNDPNVSDSLTVTSVNGAGALGTVSLVAGVVTYDPNGAFDSLAVGQTVTDSFSYTISDGHGGTSTATVTMTITGVNDAPTAYDDAFSTDEATPLNIPQASLTVNDNDPDTGDTLTVISVNGAGALGTVSLVAGVVTYDPNGAFENLAAGQTATESFSYTISDGHGGTSTATVTVTITGENDAPTAHDDAFMTNSTTPLNLPEAALTANDNDPDAGDILTVISVSGQGALGTVDLAGGVISYDPTGAFSGLPPGASVTDTFTYVVSDNHGGTSTATVTITVYANVAPIADGNGPYLVNEGSSLSLSSSGSFDPDGSIVSYEWDFDYDGVTFNVDATGASPTYVGSDGPSTFTIALRVTDNDGASIIDTTTVTVNNVAPTLENEVLTSPVDENGFTTLSGSIIDPGTLDSFTLTVNWGDGSAPETFSYAAGTTAFSEQHQYLDDNPTGTPSDVYFVSLTLQDDDGGLAPAPAANVISNPGQFSGAEQLIDFEGVTTATGFAGTTLISNQYAAQGVQITMSGTPFLAGLTDYYSNAGNPRQFAPGGDYALTDFPLVTLGSDPGPLYPDLIFSFSAPINRVGFELLSQVGVTTITLKSGGNVVASQAFNTNLNFQFIGLEDAAAFDEVVVHTDSVNNAFVLDNLRFESLYTVTVNNVAPVADAGADHHVVEGNQASLTGQFSDIGTLDTHTYLWHLMSASNGQIIPDATTLNSSFVPQDDGVYTFQFTVTDDDGGTSTDTVVIIADNLPPTTNGDSAATDEETLLTVNAPGVLNNDGDPAGTHDTLGVTGYSATSAKGATVVVHANGSYTYDPTSSAILQGLKENETTTDTFTYTVSDEDGGSTTETVTITVTGLNDEPVANPDAASVTEGAFVTGNVLTNDSDVDSDPLNVTSVALGVNLVGQPIAGTYGTLTLNADGSFIYTPSNAAPAGAPVTDTFTYTVTDHHGGTDALFISFESPTYNLGRISDGENGWSALSGTFDQNVVTNPGGQGWQFTRLVTSGSFADQPFSPALTQTAAEPSKPGAVTSTFEASWTITPQALQPGATGSYLGVSMDDGTGARGNLLRLENDAAGNWILHAFDYDHAILDFPDINLGLLPIGVATKMGFTQQFVDGAGNDVWKVYVNDQLVHTGQGWEDYFRDFQPGAAPVTYDRLLFRASGVNVTGDQGVIIDDVSYTTNQQATLTVSVQGLNNPAILSADTANLTETNLSTDLDTSGALTITDSDSPESFFAQPGTVGLYGTFTILTSGSWTYIASAAHDEFAAGTTYTDVFNVFSADGTATTVTINILGTNDEPTANLDSTNVNDGSSVTGNVLTNDTDVDGAPLSVSSVNLGVNLVGQSVAGRYGTLTLNVDGSYTYVPSGAAPAGAPVTDVFTYTATDHHGGTDALFISFESPTYNLGPISNGENGWTVLNSAFDQNVVAIPGGQGWQFTRQLTSGSYGDQPFSPALTQTAAEPSKPGAVTSFFEASWSITPQSLQAGATGSYIGVSMDDGTGARGNLFRLENDAAGNWILHAFDYDHTILDFPDIDLGILPIGVATKMGFTQQFVDGAGNDIWNVYVNDQLVYTGQGWEDYFRDYQPGVAPVTYDRLLFRASAGVNIGGDQGVIIDDVSYTTNQQSTLTVTVQGSNDAPTAVDDTFATDEDTAVTLAQAQLKGNDTDPDNANSQLSVVAVSNPSNGLVVLNGDGTVTFTPAANYNGTAGFDYTISDGSSTDIGHVTINVAAVNDQPSFVPGGAVTVVQYSGTYGPTGWATSISAGPADEIGQSLTFQVSNDNNSLFTVAGQPSLDASGNLTFTPAAGAIGSAMVTVTLQDNGGGTDTSTPQVFQITVSAFVPATLLFDFEAPGGTTATGHTSVSPATIYQSAAGYGWLAGSTPTGSIDRTTLTSVSPIPSGADGAALTALLRDANIGTQAAPGIFQADLAPNTYYEVTWLFGDTISRDLMQLDIVGGGQITAGNPVPADGDSIKNQSTAGLVSNVPTNGASQILGAGVWQAVHFTVLTDATGHLQLQFSDLAGGVNDGWVVDGLSFVPTSARTPFAITIPATVKSADASRTDFFTIAAGTYTPGAVYQVVTDFGSGATDGDSRMYQSQIQAPASGNWLIPIRRPYLTTTQTGTITVIEVEGRSIGSGTVTYTADTTTRKFDFNSTISPQTATGTTPVYGTSVYTTAKGYGWQSTGLTGGLVVNETSNTVEGSYPAGPSSQLVRDLASGIAGANNTFSLNVPLPPSGSYTYTIVVYSYDRFATASTTMSVIAEGNVGLTTGQYVISPNTYVTQSFAVSSSQISADGILDLTFISAAGNFIVDGIDVVITQLSATGTVGSAKNATSTSSIQLQTIVDAALARFSNAGATAAELELLRGVQFQIQDLGGPGYLGIMNGPKSVLIDDNGAGNGWYIDTTPLDNNGFKIKNGKLVAGGKARKQMDLLSVVMHEFTNVLKYNGQAVPSAMADAEHINLSLGQRWDAPASAKSLDSVFTGRELGDHLHGHHKAKASRQR